MATDILAGITDKSSKADMLKKLNELADIIRGTERKKAGRLSEIEARVKAKYRPGDVPDLHNVIIAATVEEWEETVEFLEEWEELLPTALARVGGRELLGPKAEESAKK